jgi:hypothetical protein
MSPETAMFVMPVTALSIFFFVIYLNIYLAKRKIEYWKMGSTIFFLQNLGTASRKRIASSWMNRFGYDQADAFRIANYQWSATLEFLLIAFVAMTIEVNAIVH